MGPVEAPDVPVEEPLRRLAGEKPGVFTHAFWEARILPWAMADPGLKVDLFRLVDVLPTLRRWGSSKYLGRGSKHIHYQQRLVVLGLGGALMGLQAKREAAQYLLRRRGP
ncbi:MAG: hypothetical protein HYZ00_03915 [Candidatus Hydrogenedentes bacterium]|nr:hypothetical protein [Candidatus Hydrogenedentota bacterium]